MPTITTAQSGNFSSMSTWVGGVLPVDNDAIVIAAGHTLTWDVDKSAWANGVAGLTITSAAGTPGRLTFPTSGGPYVLPIKTATSIAGTAPANKGQLYIGSQGSPIAATTYIKIDLLGSGQIVGGYLDVQIFGTNPTNKYVRTVNAESAGATVIEVDTDVSADWAVGDLLLIASTRTGTNFLNVVTIASIAAGAITLSGGGLTYAVNAGSFVVKLNRNVEIVSATSSGRAIELTNTVVEHTYQCAVRQATQARTGSGIGTGGVATNIPVHTVSGIISGFSIGLYEIPNVSVTGVVANATNCISGAASTASGQSTRVSGALIGAASTAFANRGGLLTSTGLIACAASGVIGELNDIAGTIIGCFNGIERSGGILRQGCVIGGSGNDANTRDAGGAQGNPGAIGTLWGYGASLRSATQVGSYLYNGDTIPGARIDLFDVADAGGNPQPGQMAWWCRGGYGKSEAYAIGTHGTPPVAMDYVHKSYFENSAARNYVDLPLVVQPGRPIRVVVYAKKQQNGMTQTPRAELIDPNRPWGHANEALATATMTDDTDWQTLTLRYDNVGFAPKQLLLRVSGMNATGSLYWNWAMHAAVRPARPFHAGV